MRFFLLNLLEMIEEIYNKYIENPVITTDSRSVPVGSIFFALKGDSFDGNRFAKVALAAGASVAVIDDPKYYTEGCVLVDNVLRALQHLANYHRNKLHLRVIGITGSNGKTTTKELLATVLSTKYNVYATKGNLNNHIGVPLTLLSLTGQTEIAIVEMGANHPGDIKELVEIAEPNFGLITNIGRAHLGGFGSFEGVVNTKAELYEFIAKKNGTIFYNQENSILSDLVSKFNLQDKSIPYCKVCNNPNVVYSDNPFLTLSVEVDGMREVFKSSLVGDYNIENILAAVTVGRSFGVDVQNIKRAIEGYIPTNNRSQFIRTAKNVVIMDAYNANPSSMELAIRNFSRLDGEKKVVILGEMFELGKYSHEEHSRIITLLNSMNFCDVFLVGKGFENITNSYRVFENSEDLVGFIQNNPIEEATILVKGSRGVKLEKVYDFL